MNTITVTIPKPRGQKAGGHADGMPSFRLLYVDGVDAWDAMVAVGKACIADAWLDAHSAKFWLGAEVAA